MITRICGLTIGFCVVICVLKFLISWFECGVGNCRLAFVVTLGWVLCFWGGVGCLLAFRI